MTSASYERSAKDIVRAVSMLQQGMKAEWYYKLLFTKSAFHGDIPLFELFWQRDVTVTADVMRLLVPSVTMVNRFGGDGKNVMLLAGFWSTVTKKSENVVHALLDRRWAEKKSGELLKEMRALLSVIDDRKIVSKLLSASSVKRLLAECEEWCKSKKDTSKRPIFGLLRKYK